VSGPSLATQIRGHLSRALYPLLGWGVRALLPNRLHTGGCLIETGSPHITPTTVARLFLGRYEAPELAFIRQYLPRDLDVLELGASIGVASARIAQRLPPKRRLICVEANPHLGPLIEQNVALNTAGCALVVLNQAIDYSGQPSVRLQISETNTNSRLSRDAGGLAVAATTLTALITQFALKSFVLVADIDGAELGLILHDQAGLSQVQQLIIELHATEYLGEVWTPERMCAALVTTHHFRVRAVRGPVYVFDRAD